jgi:hypothetical protein
MMYDPDFRPIKPAWLGYLEKTRSSSGVRLHLLDEMSRRAGQAVAAAGLPEIGGDRL